MVARVFAVLAASFLVLAVGLAAIVPVGLPLGMGLVLLDHSVVGWLQSHSPSWLWDDVVDPFMQRPAWLPAAFVGLICAGLALTFNLGKPSPRRRRS